MHSRRTPDSNPTAAPVLVTGATGFTGGHLARALKRRGYSVRALVRPSSDAALLLHDGIEVVEGDIARAADVYRAAEGVSHIYHIAAVYRTAGHPDQYYRDVNVGGTIHVLDAARRHGVQRVLHCSTCGVHGDVSRIPSDETAPYNPGDIYQLTKLEAEQAVQDAIGRGQPAVIFRPTGIYGPGDLRFLKLFKTIHQRTFRMFGSGEIPYHVIYIDDLVAGILLCGEHPAALGEIFILGGDEVVTLNELTRLVADAVGVPPPRGHLPLRPLLAAAAVCEQLCKPFGIDPPLHKRRVEFFAKKRAFSIEKARSRLGFVPRVDLAEGLRRTAQWYFESGYLRRR